MLELADLVLLVPYLMILAALAVGAITGEPTNDMNWRNGCPIECRPKADQALPCDDCPYYTQGGE